MEQKREKRRWIFILGMIFVLQLAAAFYFGGKKTGFHYDEYYSYYSSNVTNGLVPTDREWKAGEEIRNEFKVLPGEGFHYSTVVRMQTYDVHPPFYYLLLHTVCSLTPGVFSKWSGLALNLVFFAAGWAVLALLSWRLGGKRKEVLLAVCLLYGFNPAVLSGVMLVRMYMLLSFWVLWVTWLHVKALQERKRGPKFWLPLILTVYLGFLTHYYFAVYLFFLAAAMEFYLLFEKVEKKTWGQKWKDCFAYGFAVIGAMLLAVISYPACLGHIFRGYRGTEAMGAFFDLGNMAGRIRFFTGLLNEYVFGSMLPLYLLAAILLALTAWSVARLNRSRQDKTAGKALAAGQKDKTASGKGADASFAERYRAVLIPAFAAAGYFAVVTKTALLTAEEANRYQIPVYGLILLLAVLLLFWLAGERKAMWIVAAATLCLLLLGEGQGLMDGRVLFLYEEDEENIRYAQENSGQAVVYFYNGNLAWMIWDDALELMQYDEIYFVNMADVSSILDEKIAAADEVLVYVARGDNSQQALEAVRDAMGGRAQLQKLRKLLYCDLYRVTR